MTTITERIPEHYPGLKQLVLENAEIRLVVVPDLGGKITDLYSKKTGRQYLVKNDDVYKPELRPVHGSAYKPPFSSGFDECFPSVASSTIALNGSQVGIPDHGELWSQIWSYRENDGELQLTASGVNLEYRFIKTIALSGNRVKMSYRVENPGVHTLRFLWSSHPLLKINPGDMVLTLPEIDNVLLEWASDPVLGLSGGVLTWPEIPGLRASGRKAESAGGWNVLEVPARTEIYAMKVFSGRLKNGLAGFHALDAGETLLFYFDSQKVPYLGIWLCNGGWPGGRYRPEYTVALEPANGRPDNLAEAISANTAQSLEPNGEMFWDLTLEFLPGLPAPGVL